MSDDGFMFEENQDEEADEQQDQFPYDCIFIYYNPENGFPEIGVRGRFVDTKETNLVLQYMVERLNLTDYLATKKARGYA